MEAPATTTTTSNFVLVVDNNGDIDILQVSYDTSWKDLSMMLQVKFEYEKLPTFTYTDDEEEYICLDSQESYEEAVKISKANSDVLHLQIRKHGTPSLASQTQRQNSNRSNHYQLARTAIGNSLDWVRSAFNRNISTESSPAPAAQPNAELLSSEISTEVSKEMNSILQSLNQSRDQSLMDDAHQSQTTVKEPVESQSVDVSVSTSALSSMEEDRADEEVVVKEPVGVVENPQRHENPRTMDSLISRKIKEEVQSAIAREFLAFRQQITDELLSKPATGGDDVERSSSSRDITIERPRSPTEIKLEIKKLKQEMKKAKHFKKLKKLEEKSREMPKQNQDETISSIPDQPVKIRKYAASFICENLLDGSCIGVGQQFVKYWVLKNEGSVTWDYRIELKLIEEKSTDDGSSVDPESIESGAGEENVKIGRRSWGAEKSSIPMPTVETGNTAVIAVSHLAPKFPCVYTSAWRLCRGDKLFGPRIWCKVAVKSNIEAHPGSLQDESLLVSREGHSFTSQSWLGSSKESTGAPEQEPADDELSQMLSFEMTAVGDFNKETANDPEQDYNAEVSSTPKSTSLNLETPKKAEHEEDEVKEEEEAVVEVEEPISILMVEDASIPHESTHTVVEESEAAEEEDNEQEEEEVNDVEEESAPAKEVAPAEEELQVEYTLHEEQEEFDDVTNDASSDVPSDFEVIPIPECFDTSKPLTDKQAADEQSESHMPAPSHLETEESIAVEPTAPPPSIRWSSDVVVTEGSTVAVISEDSQSGRGDVAGPSSRAPPTAPAPVPTPAPPTVLTQLPPTPTMDATLPKSVCTPAPVPQSVLDMEKPYPMPGYDDGYVAPLQKVAPSQDPLILQPIPLPRGVLDADQPWVKTNPVPSPRSNSASHPSTSRPDPEPLTSQVPPTTSSNSQAAAPTVLYPSLADPNDDEEVYSLAPETPSMGPRLPILVPPGYRVPNPTPSSEIALPPVEVAPPAAPGQIPRDANPGAPNEPSLLEQLVDMGFYDIELNEDLLREFQGDLNKVVNALVYRSSEGRTPVHSRNRRNNGGFLA